jgi:hypothetical protein
MLSHSRSHGLGHGVRLLCVAVVFGAAVAAAPAQAGPASAGVAVGFARVNLGDGTVSAWGGKGTKAVTTGPSGGTGLIIFFDGKFPKDLTRDAVVVQATAEASEPDQFAVANAIVSTAASDQIVVTVNGWIAGTETPVDGYVFLTVWAATVPKP